jgi:hypothetical protein
MWLSAANCWALGNESEASDVEEAGEVVVLLRERDSPTARRLQAEIADLDVRVVVLQVKRNLDQREGVVERLARSRHAAVAILLRADGRSVLVWLWDPHRDEPSLRTVNAGGGSADLRTDALVVGTIELVRAHLLAVERPPEPKPEPEPEPIVLPPLAPGPPPERPTPHPAPFAFAASAGPDKPANDWSWGLSYQLNLEAALTRALGTRLLVRLPVTTSSVGAAAAKAEVEAQVLGGALTLDTTLSEDWIVGGYLGGSGVHLSAKGFSTAAAATRTESHWVFGLLLGAHLRWHFQASLGLIAQAGTVIVPTRAEIILNDQSAGSWGRPGFMSGLGLEFRPSWY